MKHEKKFVGNLNHWNPLSQLSFYLSGRLCWFIYKKISMTLYHFRADTLEPLLSVMTVVTAGKFSKCTKDWRQAFVELIMLGLLPNVSLRTLWLGDNSINTSTPWPVHGWFPAPSEWRTTLECTSVPSMAPHTPLRWNYFQERLPFIM